MEKLQKDANYINRSMKGVGNFSQFMEDRQTFKYVKREEMNT
jgi:hypothetical protein